MNTEIHVGEIYVHHKGNYVKVLAKCKHTETSENMIAYIHVYNARKGNTDPNLLFTKSDDDTIWVRPESMWFDEVKPGVTRFTKFNKEK